MAGQTINGIVVRGKVGGPRPGSGRPPGTPNKSTKEVRELAIVHGPAAIAKAVYLMENAEMESTKIAAIRLILERAYGLPTQNVKHAGLVGTWDLSKLPLERLELIRSVLSEVALVGGPGQGDSDEAG